MISLNIAKLRSCGNLQSFPTVSKVRTLSYVPAKTNENGTFESLNKSIGMGQGSRKTGPAGYTWIPMRSMQHAMPTSRMA